MSLDLSSSPVNAAEVTLSSGDLCTVRRPAAEDAVLRPPVAVFCHGRGSNRTQIDDEAHRPLRDELLTSGYVVVSADAGGSTWGSAVALQHMQSLKDYLDHEFSDSPVIVMGESMGGSLASALVTKGIFTPQAVFLAAPSVSLKSAYRRDPADYAEEYTALFGRVPEGNDDFFREWDQAETDLSRFNGVPVLIYTGTQDTIVSYEGVVKPFAERLRDVRAHVILRTTPTGHGDAENLPPLEVRKFLDAAMACQ